MAHVEQISSTGHAYARSLLELAVEQRQADEIFSELKGIRQILDEYPDFAEYLADPGISTEHRQAALERIFGGRISKLLQNFLGVLNRNARLRQFDEIMASYAELYDEQFGIVEVDVTSVMRLSDAELEQVRERVSRCWGNRQSSTTTRMSRFLADSSFGFRTA